MLSTVDSNTKTMDRLITSGSRAKRAYPLGFFFIICHELIFCLCMNMGGSALGNKYQKTKDELKLQITITTRGCKVKVDALGCMCTRVTMEMPIYSSLLTHVDHSLLAPVTWLC